MGNYNRMLPGGDLERIGAGNRDSLVELIELRALLPPYYTPEQQGAMAWEAGDFDAARFAFGVADKIEELKRLAL